MSPKVFYRTVRIDGLNIFYREAGPKTLRLCYCFTDYPRLRVCFSCCWNASPTSTIWSRPIILASATAIGLIRSSLTIDHIARVIDDLKQALGLTRYTLYMQDYGWPVGFRELCSGGLF